MNLSGKNIAIIGYGLEGRAAAKFASAKGANITVCDSKNDLDASPYDAQLGDKYLDNLDSFDLVFRSPVIQPALLKDANKVTSNTNWFLENSPATTVGVTGSKGKGTTSTLIHEFLKVLDVQSWLAGNVGTPALQILDNIKVNDVAVLELSSFQLIDAVKSPDIAVCLMIEPDHMNWHHDMDEYIDAKARITLNQTANNVFVHHPTNLNVQKIVVKSPAQKVAFGYAPSARIEDEKIIFLGSELMPVAEVGMIGRHNLENICAALTAIEHLANLKSIDIASKLSEISTVIRNFKGLEHRLEFVRTIDGVQYYNDTFAVMPDAAIAGIEAFTQPVVSIIGGVDKKVELSNLADTLASKAKSVILVGEIAEKMSELLESRNFKNAQIIRGSMNDIVQAASDMADSGDVVLLSPGSSSFDMFDNYKQRGNLFKEAVNAL